MSSEKIISRPLSEEGRKTWDRLKEAGEFGKKGEEDGNQSGREKEAGAERQER